MTGRTFEIREFTLHDGPGARTTVFFKGCPLRCAWCHNPEGQNAGIETMSRRKGGEAVVCGTDWSAPELARELMKNADFLSLSGGGITFSGGEPLVQTEFLLELIPVLRGMWTQSPVTDAKPLHLALETSGFAPAADYRRVVGEMDFVYQDLKHPDPAEHRRWTGVDPAPIYGNLEWLKDSGRRFVARIPLIPGVNDTKAALDGFARLLEGAKGLERVELLPYNAAAGAKYRLLGREWNPGFNEKAAPCACTEPFSKRGMSCVVM